MNDIDWSKFLVSADHDGAMALDHDELGCRKTPWLTGAYFTIAELIELTENHLKTCPVWTGGRS